jgi:hypothetical protein
VKGKAGAMTALALVWVAAVRGTASVASSADAAVRAPQRLSETGLYAGGVETIDPRNRSFSPQYPLWSDGAIKRRWVFLPPGTTIDTSDPRNWVYPVGTRFWKEFAFGGRKVETRMLWRASADDWVFATYAWNEEQTDAVLAPADGIPGAADLAGGKRHSIPGEIDCESCHGTTRRGPLGFNSLQLSTDRDPNAIHGEPLPSGALTLATLEREHLLSPSRPELVDAPPRIRASDPLTRSVLGYFAGNCGHCHNGTREIGPAFPSLKHSDVGDGDGVARGLLAYATAWQLPGRQDGTRLIDPASPAESALLARVRSRSPLSQMPPLGTVLRDDAAVDAITKWIIALPASGPLLRSSTGRDTSSRPRGSRRQ